MNACRFACISASISFLLLTYIPSASSATDGIITFTGAIVESPCSINNLQHAVDIECYRNGNNTHTITPLNSSQINFPGGKATGITWLNTAHTLGIMNVEYQ
ncbi:Uncharacterised protein [Yersinia pekkanenii]|uniref:Type 1 fimbrial protein n=1 Tax=Yersinia pekkanenii TaxID=1288385 RepID=A0A0T9Q8F9_9GAMM|nr:Uncharacterised protein [Yersinia pekkanenii]CRY63566.1 Uncharacterised protein [Yersinia pekkanenii]